MTPFAPPFLVTRPDPDGAALAQLAQRAGFDPVLTPVMAMNYVNASVSLNGVKGLVFTSANGVRAFAGKHQERHLRCYAIGESTAREAAARGFDDVLTADSDTPSLVRLIEKTYPGGHLLHVAGAHRTGDLANCLKARGVFAERVMLYEMIASDHLAQRAVRLLINGKDPIFVGLFSRRSASIFVDLAERAGVHQSLTNVVAIAVSKPVCEQIAHLPWKNRATAKSTSAQSVIDAAIALKNELSA